MQTKRTISRRDYYGRLNLHPPIRRKLIRKWIEERGKNILNLYGSRESGRQYLLDACCEHERVDGKRIFPIHINLDESDIPSLMQRSMQLRSEQKDDWKNIFSMVEDSLKIEHKTSLSQSLSLGLLLSLPGLLKELTTRLEKFIRDRQKSLDSNPWTEFRLLLQQSALKQPVLLSICQADAIDGGSLNVLWGLVNDVNVQQHLCPVYLALSSTHVVNMNTAIYCGRLPLTYLKITPLTANSLRAALDESFPANRFDNQLIQLLIAHGSMQQPDYAPVGHAKFIASALLRLMAQGLLGDEHQGWHFSGTPVELQLELGKPLRDLWAARIATLESSLLPQVQTFMMMAAMCQPLIPQQTILRAMKIDPTSEAADDLLDAIEDGFCVSDPPILEDLAYSRADLFPSSFHGEIALYRLMFPLLAAIIIPREQRQPLAKKLLELCRHEITVSTSAQRQLFWQLAEHAGDPLKREWHTRLLCRFEPESAEAMEQSLVASLCAETLGSMLLLQHLDKAWAEHRSVIELRCGLKACDTYYQTLSDGRIGMKEHYLFAMLQSYRAERSEDGSFQQAMAWLEQAEQMAGQCFPAPSHEQAEVYYRMGSLLIRLGQFEQAEQKLRHAYPMFQQLGELINAALTMGQIADILYSRGNLVEALRIRQEEELPVYEKLGDVRARADTMGNIANILYTIGNLDEALRIRQEEQLPVYEKLGDVRSRAAIMGEIADILEVRGNLDEALRIRQEEQLPVYEKLGDVRARAFTMGRIADILQEKGNLNEGLRIRQEEELPVYEKLGDVRGLLIGRFELARLLLHIDQEAHKQQALTLLTWSWVAATVLQLSETEVISEFMENWGLDLPDQKVVQSWTENSSLQLFDDIGGVGKWE